MYLKFIIPIEIIFWILILNFIISYLLINFRWIQYLISQCEWPILWGHFFKFSFHFQWFHYEKIGWFIIGLATRFLNCNDHVQLHYKLTYFYDMSAIEWIVWIAMDKIHYTWNQICMQFMQLNCNYAKTTIVQFQCNKFTTTIVMSCWYWFSLQFLGKCGCDKNTLMTTTNWQLCDNSHWV